MGGGVDMLFITVLTPQMYLRCLQFSEGLNVLGKLVKQIMCTPRDINSVVFHNTDGYVDQREGRITECVRIIEIDVFELY